MAKLLVQLGKQSQTLELRPGVNRIGRAEGNDFQITDGSISSFHCVIDVNDIASTVRDLKSTNGTYINGQRVEGTAVLQNGQKLRLGNVETSFEAAEVVIAIPTLSLPDLPTQAFFADGTPACMNHPLVAALYLCTACNEYHCSDCVRRLGLKGREKIFCPRCSAVCGVAPHAETAKPKRTFGTLIRDTVRLVFKQP